ncbi:MAG: hypothetical protein ABIL09_22165 [Gemmatimonadota bacterium]
MIWLALILVLIAIILVYYFLLVPRIQQMLDLKASPVLLAFALIALIPVPPLVVLGVLVMIIWDGHRMTLAAEA